MNDPQFEVGNKGYDNSPGFSAEPPPKKQRGCFFYGCVFAAVLAVIGVILAGALTYTGYYYYTKLINDYTSTTPAELTKFQLPEDQLKSLNDRVAEYKKAIDGGRAFDLVLTADEVNSLINENEDLKGKVYITIKGDQVSGQLSIPLGATGLPGTKGRFLNCSAALKASIKNGEFDVRAQDLVVNDKPLPPSIKTSLANENLAKDFSNNPENAKFFAKIESFEVKDDKIFIKTKAKAGDDAKSADKPKIEDATPPKDEAPAKADGKDAAPAKEESKSKEEAAPKAAA